MNLAVTGFIPGIPILSQPGKYDIMYPLIPEEWFKNAWLIKDRCFLFHFPSG